MANGMYHQLSASPHSTPSLEDQKAFGILIETLDPSQYRYNQHATQVRTAYETFVIQHEPTSKIDRIQVAMEWIKLSWDMRQEPCRTSSITSKRSSNDYTTSARRSDECRKKARDAGQPVKKSGPSSKDEDSNTTNVFMFSAEDLDMSSLSSNNGNEDMQNNIEYVPEVLGEPDEPTEVNDPTWSAHTRPRRTINLNRMRYECTFMSRTEFDTKSEGDEAMVAHDEGSNSMAHRIIVDSGASTRMTGASKHLYDRKKCHRQVVQVAQVANGGVTVATTLGKLNIITPNKTVLTLTDVLLVDGMTSTL
ncbi:hypothetical protein DYB32_004938 [Aphanomyces invadans]|uniref:Retrovirus-related Pol polyprotein from transposon TNT 1-94-like beta-barrel domain-containing protein n=1 Tax=Aphanomyces invadans TaxID=157072 RepID=A0A3R7D0I3_9STRA|nr:hypothetical protein DYB32_004938 [Aphanomyces invadans]